MFERWLHSCIVVSIGSTYGVYHGPDTTPGMPGKGGGPPRPPNGSGIGLRDRQKEIGR